MTESPGLVGRTLREPRRGRPLEMVSTERWECTGASLVTYHGLDSGVRFARAFDCSRYDECLAWVAARDWPGFDCSSCARCPARDDSALARRALIDRVRLRSDDDASYPRGGEVINLWYRDAARRTARSAP
jgi:hypothetical protein